MYCFHEFTGKYFEGVGCTAWYDFNDLSLHCINHERSFYWWRWIFRYWPNRFKLIWKETVLSRGLGRERRSLCWLGFVLVGRNWYWPSAGSSIKKSCFLRGSGSNNRIRVDIYWVWIEYERKSISFDLGLGRVWEELILTNAGFSMRLVYVEPLNWVNFEPNHELRLLKR